MKVEKLQIENYRGLENVLLNADAHINLIVGVNGAGKSTILDALACPLSWFIARMRNPKGNGTTIPFDDIQNEKFTCEIRMTTDIAGAWTVSRQTAYALYKNNRIPTSENHKTDLSAMTAYIRSLQEKMTNQNISLPAIVYYRVNRSVTSIPLKVQKHPHFNILDAYENALDEQQGFRRFFEWYREREDLENENFRFNRGGTDRQLDAVRRALISFFPEYHNVRIHRNPLAMALEKQGHTFKLSQLSDGEKCYISLICDLSRRLAIANPALEDPLQGEGIVLIDEIELHLHPKWQMEVIGKLRKTFPNCQFFISTHSPHIVSDIRKEQLFLLRDGELVEPSFNTYGKLVNDILTDFFDIPVPRNIEVREKIEEAEQFLNANEHLKFTQAIKELEELLGRADIEIAALRLEALKKGVRL